MRSPPRSSPPRPDPNLNGTLITGPDAVTAVGDYLNHRLVTPGDSSADG